MICKIWKKDKLSSEMIWKIQKKIVKIIWKKSKLNSENILKIENKVVQRIGKYRRKLS
jgi:hypothetical protein